jgi:sporulation protein YlmC with PRC-barrel domain
LKKRQELLGLPIISIEDGDDIGRVGELVPDFKAGQIAAIALERKAWHQIPEVILYSAVVGVGGDAITVDSRSSVHQLHELPELVQLLESDVDLIGLQVMTKHGQTIGTVAEFVVEPQSGRITHYLLGTEGPPIAAEDVISIGRRRLIVDRVPTPESAAGDPDGTLREPPTPRPAAPVSAPETDGGPKGGLRVVGVSDPEPTPPTVVTPVTVPELKDLERLREAAARQHERVVMRARAGRTVRDDAGNVIVNQGDEVTPEVIARARKADKFAELVESVRHGSGS